MSRPATPAEPRWRRRGPGVPAAAAPVAGATRVLPLWLSPRGCPEESASPAAQRRNGRNYADLEAEVQERRRPAGVEGASTSPTSRGLLRCTQRGRSKFTPFGCRLGRSGDNLTKEISAHVHTDAPCGT